MTENSMFSDLRLAQMEIPAIQATAINPAYRSRYVTLEELLDKVLPVLNAHNFCLVQQPTVQDGKPALRTVLMHSSGEVLESTMLLVDADTSQHHGAALTYARRYSLTAWLGLTADTDDDAESTKPPQRTNAAPRPPQRRETGFEGIPAPECPQHAIVCNLVPGGTSKASGKPYSSFYSCPQKGCGANGKSWTVFADKWATDWQLRQPPEELPFTDEEAFAGMPSE